MILVDTSVWIDFLIGKNSSFRKELHRLIEQGEEIAITGIILQEILQGIRSDLDYQKTKADLLQFHYFSYDEPLIFLRAAEIYRKCRQKGKTIRKPVDCLIAAQAMESKAELFHQDRDFTQIAQVVPLKVYSMK